ncbi:MAG: DUF1329 domain-containing protein, partial [Deltaproteobacteria bacterium]|nr:DUF1329 domain-containing protein [Deltaproteobacteria bacterium]
PMGAEIEGNADGMIPPWTGAGVPVPPGYKGPGTHHPDPFPNDNPLFIVTAANMNEYADRLTDGQKMLLKTYPDTFKMQVYPSRRTATYPDFYVENTFNNATTAELEEGGNGVKNAHGGIPFPIPQSGTEAIWNHILRYQGVYRVDDYTQFTPDANGRYVNAKTTRWQYYPYYDSDKVGDKILTKLRILQQSPPRLAGDVFLFHDFIKPMENTRLVWKYFGGQRRVRRAPVFVYDTPIPPALGFRVMDDLDMFFGSPDRYEWTLVGKKELFIPYNNYRLASPDLKYEHIIKRGHINSDYTRYELHRVWVVEANLREGERHIYKKRINYIDEDSWNIVIADKYDKKDQIWRCAMSYLKTYWEVPLVYKVVEVHHDMVARRYNSLPHMNEQPKGFDWQQPVPKDSFFTPAALRRVGVR